MGVEIIGYRFDDRRTDVNQIGHLVGLDGVGHQLRRVNVVPNKVLIFVTADLRLQQHHDIRPDEMIPLVAWLSEIGILNRDIRLNPLKSGKVGNAIVENADI